MKRRFAPIEDEPLRRFIIPASLARLCRAGISNGRTRARASFVTAVAVGDA
jgi:hypothetical protein